MPNISLPEFADKVGEIMPVIMKEFYRQQSSQFYRMKITMPQFVVMDILARNGEMKMTDMARLLNVTTAAMTGIVDRLVRDHYVARGYDSDDRRLIKVSLTAKGDRAVRDIMDNRKHLTMKIFGVISREERDEYLKILSHIKDHLGAQKK